MKKSIIKAVICFSAISILSTSCERELDQVSTISAPAETAMVSENNFTQAIDAAYSAIKGSYYFSTDTGNQLVVADATVDNLVMNPNGRTSNSSAYNWNFSNTNYSVAGLYDRGYFVIARANFPLKYLNNLADGDFKKNIEAQARAIRAMVHFDIVRAYAKIPTQSTDAGSSLGIAYVDTFDPLSKSNTRNLTVNEVYDKIIADLKFAADNIIENRADKARLSKAAVYGLLSRVYLYKGDYQNALSAAQSSIALSTSVGSRTNFPLIWNAENPDGVLLSIQNGNSENVSVGVGFQQGATATGGTIKSEYTVPKSFYNLYKTTDVRKNAYIRQTTVSNILLNHVIKYAYRTSPASSPLNVVNVKYLRTAEVYLNGAEAAYKVGLQTEALRLLNVLRNERYTGFTNGTEMGTALLDAIMLERRLELAFENDRFYTFKRLGMPLQRTGEGANADGTGSTSNTQRVEASDNRWQWPIPKDATDANPAIVQNPGY